MSKEQKQRDKAPAVGAETWWDRCLAIVGLARLSRVDHALGNSAWWRAEASLTEERRADIENRFEEESLAWQQIAQRSRIYIQELEEKCRQLDGSNNASRNRIRDLEQQLREERASYAHALEMLQHVISVHPPERALARVKSMEEAELQEAAHA